MQNQQSVANDCIVQQQQRPRERASLDRSVKRRRHLNDLSVNLNKNSYSVVEEQRFLNFEYNNNVDNDEGYSEESYKWNVIEKLTNISKYNGKYVKLMATADGKLN
jgi:hypothetical protein